jgi:hypothetical protein
MLPACGLGDDVAAGARAQCAEGGALNDTCDGPTDTPEAACWRLVDCGAIPVHRNDRYNLDWNRCVELIQETGDVQAHLIMSCIGASTCDQLKVSTDACFAFGEN